MTMTVTPLPGRLLVKEDDNEYTLTGRIYYQAPTDRSHRTGLVTHVSEDEGTIRVGDRVIYPAGHGQHHTVDGQELVGLQRENVWGLLQ